MSDYQKQVKEEATAFFASVRQEFSEDAEEFGGKSDRPNLARWIDRKEKLAARVEEICSKWTHKDYTWVRSNTRNPSKDGGGDPRSHAFASFLQDVRHEIKKLAKSSRGQ